MTTPIAVDVESLYRVRAALHTAYVGHADTAPAEQCEPCGATARIALVAMYDAGWRPGGLDADPRYLRWCEWPGCLRAFNAATGPDEIDGRGWVHVRDGGHLLLCPDHAERGHRLQHFEWDLGDTVIATSCECGARGEGLSPTNIDRCRRWWREHVTTLEGTDTTVEPERKWTTVNCLRFPVRVGAEMIGGGDTLELARGVAEQASDDRLGVVVDVYDPDGKVLARYRNGAELEKYPAQLCVYCDNCGHTHCGDYVVSDADDRATRLGFARDHLRGEGWSCGLLGDYCPKCVASAAGVEGEQP